MAYAFKRGNIWYIRYKDESGRWQTKSCGKDANRSDADYLAGEFTAKGLNRRYKIPLRIIDVTLEQALILFRDTIISRSTIGIDKQESTIRREKASIENILSFTKNRNLIKFDSFNKEIAQRYMDHRAKSGMSPKTRREERRVLRKFFKWAVKQNYCMEDPTEEIAAPRLPKRRPRFFSEEELKQIFECAKDPYKTIFKFLYLTGLRTGELCNLEWRDYNTNLKTLTIRIVSANKKQRTPGNKTKREETIPLCMAGVQVLEERKKARDSERFIFLNHGGNRLDNDNIYRNLKPILTDQHIAEASPHTFRHTFASHLVIRGISIYIVKDLLRHASVKEKEIYAHLSKETTRSAVEQLSLSFSDVKRCGRKEIPNPQAIPTLHCELNVNQRLLLYKSVSMN